MQACTARRSVPFHSIPFHSIPFKAWNNSKRDSQRCLMSA
ncbi:hypothetical protein SynPROS91_02152 [Synechococcus sp. PROS-9-1]|nr:hypothetical protein SynPROS91_02152 [Synechococcus sp. PROS-9-1]